MFRLTNEQIAALSICKFRSLGIAGQTPTKTLINNFNRGLIYQTELVDYCLEAIRYELVSAGNSSKFVELFMRANVQTIECAHQFDLLEQSYME